MRIRPPALKGLEPHAGVLSALFGGLCLGLAAPDFGWWPLTWVAVVPFLIYLERSERPPAFWLGTLLGMIYYLMLLYWLLGFHPLTWLGIAWWPSLAIAVGAWLFVSVSQAWLVGLWASLLVRSRLGGWQRIVFGTGLWVALHWLWGQGDTAFPWGNLAQSQVPDVWVLQIVSLGGSQLLVGGLVAFNLLLAAAFTRPKRFGPAALALLVTTHLYGLVQLARPPVPAGSLRIGVIQGNIAQARKWTAQGRRQAIDTYVRGYEKLAAQGAQLVLTPESAFAFVWPRLTSASLPLVAEIRARRVPVLLSAFDRRPDGQLSTAIFALGSEAQVLSFYNKIHLVPLGEQIPFKGLIGPLVRKLSPIQAEVYPGTLDQRLLTPYGPIAGGICFDSAFSEGFRAQVANGARLLVQATNDAWYGPAMAPEHHAFDALRATETGRYLVRASNNGTSALIDSHGRTVRITGWNTYADFIEAVPLLVGYTPYVRWGEWFVPVAAAGALAGLLLGRTAPKK
ncbi:apolipoprotein N-acyltransferase [Gloeobacter kilaueensis]|uniref:Apolipoprotein N-acyltransferase n=1 Tax=Gloeobacter kilaueensis (strain ATCC BAA-2537 / CCAP 1431/1 / ULC 316 / JS1) TaxID=1183438 RepID=U5QSD5_GLOK1|nr:apolipoprotein N-acyltransferase [Gloeobacter kilaueensis]AGY60574.1 apolipoprotein N-acyltransferase [Gloeobacter kilaueensis JS1]